MRTRLGVRHAVLGLLALAAWMVASSAVSADTASAASWRCHASVAYVRVSGLAKLEPIVANSPQGRRCYDDATGLKDIDLGGSNSAGQIQIHGATARTDVSPNKALQKNQTASADATAASVHITDPTGKIIIGVDGLRSNGKASCVNGQFSQSGNVSFATVTLNGKPIPTDGIFKMIGDGLNGLPTSQLLKISFDEVKKDGDANSIDQSVTRRAVHVQILNRSDGRSVFEAALGESTIGRSGDPCTEPPVITPRWMCRSSVARIQVSNLLRLEPVVANTAPQANCANDLEGVNTLNLGSASVGGIQVEAASAQTTLAPLNVDTMFQTATSDTDTGQVTITTADGKTVLEVDAATSHASGSCVNGSPSIAGETHVVNVNLNGHPISPDDVFEQIGDGVNGTPLGQIVHIEFNTHTVSHPASGTVLHTFDAIHLQVLRSEDRAPLVDAVVGESTIGARGNLC
jgi:hypothetical protein